MKISPSSYFVQRGDKRLPVHPDRSSSARLMDSDGDGLVSVDEILARLGSSSLKHDKDLYLDFHADVLTKTPPPQATEYPDSRGLGTEMNKMAERYPDDVQVITLGESREGRPIEALKIGHGLMGVGISSLVHGREWATANASMKLAHSLLNQRKDLLSEMTVWVLPNCNPDGYEKSLTDDPGHRGNAAGVDLNRNFPSNWRPDGDNPLYTFDDIGASDNPESLNFRGTFPASEPETQALVNFISEHSELKGWLDFHSAGDVVLLPRDADAKTRRIATEMSEVAGLGTMKLSDYGTVSGVFMDYVQPRGMTTLALEIGDGFQPGYEKAQEIGERGKNAGLTFLDGLLS